MAITRACTYSAVIETPDSPSEYVEALVTFAQNQRIVVEKTLQELEVSDGGFIVHLSQQETKLFRPSQKSPVGAAVSGPALMQVRVYKDAETAPGSDIWAIDVNDVLNDGVIGNG